MTTDPPVKIIRQHRRSMMMRATFGAIEVYIPTHYQEGDKCVVNFIKKNLPKLSAQVPATPPPQLSQVQLDALLASYCARMDAHPARVQWRDMRRKWGSCSSLGTITLNTRLAWLPEELAGYIMCHELAHLRELNHSKAFWAIVGQYIPDYKEKIATLRALERAWWGM